MLGFVPKHEISSQNIHRENILYFILYAGDETKYVFQFKDVVTLTGN